MLDNSLVIPPKQNSTARRQNSQPIYNGPWIVGENCHIIIDGVGYIIANNVDYAQESGRAMGSEQTAPFFGDPVNYVDPQSSDMTMLLPIGQNDFTNGIGSLKLENDPKGYELVNNLQLTPQNTLFNGPAIQTMPISGAKPTDARPQQEGYFAGAIYNGTPREFFGVGSHLYYWNGTSWLPLTARFPITDLFGYAGFMLVSYGDNGGDIIDPTLAINPIAYLPYKGFLVDGDPFVIYKDGRIYSAFLLPPSTGPVLSLQDGPDATYDSWEYCVNYALTLPGGAIIQTGLSPASLIDKIPNKEILINIPGVPWKSGPVNRELYRSLNNNPATLYRIADAAALGSIRSQWVDTATDAAVGALTAWNWNQQNTTAMQILRAGDVTHNMWRSDTQPIWLPEYGGAPNTGDRVWSVSTFRDTQGDEAIIIGTTSGLFSWDGVSDLTQTLRPINFGALNCFSMAVNHGQVYYVTNDNIVHIWSNSQEAFLNGPWVIQYNLPYDIRLIAAGEYVFIAVCGRNKYNGMYRQSIYRYNGQIFDWQTYKDEGAPYYPILGKLLSEHSFAWYPNDTATDVQKVTMDPRYTGIQQSNVQFRSALSDCGLPRLRKQVFAVMIRYLQLTQNFSVGAALSQPASPGDTIIYISGVSGLAVGDWFAIDDPFPNFQEYRQVTAVTPTTISFSHPLGGALVNSHTIGMSVFKCAAVVTLRNVFTAENATPRDIQVGGPYRGDYLFSYIHLPRPVYTFLDGIQIDYNASTQMELVGWSMLTALNPPYYGLLDLNLRIQDQVKLPNNMFHPFSANDLVEALRAAYNKGAVDVIDQFNNYRKMRVQRMSVDYEEPKQRHQGEYQNQASAHIRLLDQDSELFKQESLVLGIATSQ